MNDGFEQDFYRSPWHRVLPLGPGGIQPHLRTGGAGLPAGLFLRLHAAMRSLKRGIGAFVRGLGAFGAFGRWGASADARATPAHAGRPGAVPIVSAAPRPVAQAAPRRPLRRAA